MKKLSIVVPCYNEEEVFASTCETLTNYIKYLINKNLITSDSYILFVNDGSKDNTWNQISDECSKNTYVQGLKLSRNVGHQNALFAGLMTAKNDADIIISIDADLQDDINVIEEMVKKSDIADIVYGVRNSRKKDSFFKRTTALAFYKFMQSLGTSIIYNHADFRLMSSRVLDELEHYEERNLFLRGIVPMIGFTTDIVYYARNERLLGESKYPLKKMIAFALDGITSFSIKPLKLITLLGSLTVLISFGALIYVMISYLSGKTVPGWTSLILSVWFLNGLVILSIGVAGEYIGKIYMEVKKRPRYAIETHLKKAEKNEPKK